jgi:hypothetical protein
VLTRSGYPYTGCAIRRTTDGGVNWETQFVASDTALLACHFLDAMNGWVGGGWSECDECPYYNVLLHTTDGGATWQPQTFGEVDEERAVLDVAFADLQYGWALREDGVFVTSDGGINWYPQETPATQRLYALAVNEPHSVWAVGGNGAILHWEGTNSAEPPRTLLPQQFAFTAFPNPFNPTTTLEFSLPTSGLVQMKVYDVTGRLATTLTNRFFPQGQHHITFDGSSLPSGIYFARLQGNSFGKTQKLVLLK